MMQETGNNIQENKKILSIRLNPGGLYFSVADFPAAEYAEGRCISFGKNNESQEESVRRVIEANEIMRADYAEVRVSLDTADTVFIPSEIIRGRNAAEVLSGMGIAPRRGSGVTVAGGMGDMAAMIEYDAATMYYLRSCYDTSMVFYSPLRDNLQQARKLSFPKGGFIANITGRNIYLTRFDEDKSLLIAEVYPCAGDADVVYYLHHLIKDSEIKDPVVYLMGPVASQACKTVKKYFRKVLCV